MELGRFPVSFLARRLRKALHLPLPRHPAALTAGPGAQAPNPATGAATAGEPTAESRAAEGHREEAAPRDGGHPLQGEGAHLVTAPPHQTARKPIPLSLTSCPLLASSRSGALIKVRTAIEAVSSDPDKAFLWILEVEREGATLEDFARHDNSPFRTLDAKLKRAIADIAKGQIANMIMLHAKALARLGRSLSGRQCLLIVYQYYNTDKDMDPVYTLSALLNLELVNDDLEILFACV